MRVRLEDVCEKESSKLKQSDVIDQNGMYPVYGASGYLRNINTYQQSNYYIAVVKDGAGIGRTMLLPPESSIIGTMQYLIPKDNVLPEYLYYVVKAKHLEKYFSGATIPHIYFKDYKNEQFDLVSFEEQREIINRLKKIEIIIENLSKNLLLLDELVKARFVEMFGDENNSKGWEIVNIEDVANVQVGVVIKPSQYYTDQYNGIKAFRSLNIGDGYIKDDDWVYFSKEGNKKNKKSILSTNDVLVVRSGAPGTACVVTSEYAGSNAIDVIIAHPDFQKVDSRYLCTYTNMPHGKSQIIEGTGGAAQQHFNVGKYNKLKLMLPPLEYQKQYVKFLEEIDKSRSRIQKSLEASQELFDSLMQKYFG